MRKFNEVAYNNYDYKCKVAAINFMKKKGFTLIGDIDTEHYKKFDLQFINESGKIVKIENEFRGPFNDIKNKYYSVHIPYRKKETECDFYFIWGNEWNDLAVIKKDILKKYSDNVINQVCAKGKPYEFVEKFIDIPKEKIYFLSVDKIFTE
jgi:hypothetical protein